MNKIATIAWREFIETVRTRTFVFTSIFMPMLMLGLIFGSEWIADVAAKQKDPPRNVAVMDEAGGAAAVFEESVATWNEGNPSQQFVMKPVAVGASDEENQAKEDEAKRQVLEGDLYGFVRIPAAALDPDAQFAFLPKPFTLPQLAAKVKEELMR